jgi:hypothetical protein
LAICFHSGPTPGGALTASCLTSSSKHENVTRHAVSAISNVWRSSRPAGLAWLTPGALIRSNCCICARKEPKYVVSETIDEMVTKTCWYRELNELRTFTVFRQLARKEATLTVTVSGSMEFESTLRTKLHRKSKIDCYEEVEENIYERQNRAASTASAIEVLKRLTWPRAELSHRQPCLSFAPAGWRSGKDQGRKR